MTSKEPTDMTRAENGDVAIIGMAGVFPKAPDIHKFWENIVSKVDAIGDPPEGSLTGLVFDPDATANNRIYCERGGYLEDLLRFDPSEFGIMPVAVDGAEPEHFMALKVAHDALIDAGFPDKPFNRERTEVILGRGTFVNRGFIGLMQRGMVLDQTIRLLKQLHPEHTDDELASIEDMLKAQLPPFTPETAAGLCHNVMAGIIANRLNLRGANLVIDAACASALIGLEIGKRDLVTHKCDVALVGGVQISTHAPIHMVFSQLGALSRRPQLRPFDKDADGTMLGEGIGIIVLKRKADAIKDGHRIYALVRGVGSSSDGRGKGLLAPQADGEELALRRAYEDAAVNPKTVELIEAHGTAIPLGDVTEIQSLKRVFGPWDGGRPRCAIGTVKSMIGHLIPAAGIAGMIKAALAIYHKVLPPTLYCDQPNPAIEIEKTPFYINTETRPWIHGTSNSLRRAGVSAFGFGGINSHAVLEEYPGADEADIGHYHQEWETELCILEGQSRRELTKRCDELHEHLLKLGKQTLLDIAYNINLQLNNRPYRLAIVASSVKDLTKKIAHSIERLKDSERVRIKDKSGIYFFEEPLAKQGKLAFLFPGEGSQYVNMLSDVCLHFPEARSCFDLLDKAYADDRQNYLPSQIIFPPTAKAMAEAETRILDMDGAVDAVTTADRALYTVATLMGIRPDAILGHSSGEMMAFEAAGAVELSGEQEIIYHIRAGNGIIEALKDTNNIPEGRLLAVGGVDRETISSIVDKSEDFLCIAMDNCPHQFVLCGTAESSKKASAELRKLGGICQPLPFRRAYHTERFDQVLEPLQKFFNDIKFVVPNIPIYSCMTAGLYPQDPEAIRRLAVKQWARPVRFRETIDAMYRDGIRIFLELGPKAHLTGFVNDVLKGKEFLAVAANVHHRSDITQLNHAFALLLAHGVPFSVDALYRHRKPRNMNLEDNIVSATKRNKAAIKLSLELPLLSLENESLNLALASQTDSDTAMATAVNPPVSDVPSQSQSRASSNVMPSDAMQEYFNTMENFLNVQRQVMQAFLEQSDALKTDDLDGQAANITALHDTFPGSTQRSSLSEAEDNFGGPGAADNATMLQGSDDQVLRNVAQTHSSPSLDIQFNEDNIKKLLLKCMSDKTGYPEDMFTMDQNLEADLGIDSIKKVEILGALSKHLGSLEHFQSDELNSLKTIGQIVDFLSTPLADTSQGGQGLPEKRRENFQRTVRPDTVPIPVVDLPFKGEVVQMVPGQEITVMRQLDMDEDLFLRHHTLGGNVSKYDQTLLALPVMPFSMTSEIMANTAARLFPGMLLVGIKNVKAHDWIIMKGQQLALQITAKANPGSQEARVELRTVDIAGEQRDAALAMEGTMIFDEAYPQAPAVEDLQLGSEIPACIPPEQFYPSAMFHGPSFQSVSELKRSGPNGIEAVLEIPPSDRFFRHITAPQFTSDAVLIDAAGQVVGLWAGGYLERNFVVFPVSIQEIRLFAPALSPGCRAVCRLRTHLEGQDHIRSEVDVVNSDGTLQVKLEGLKHKRINMPREFHLFRGSRDIMLSSPWPAPIEPFKQNGAMACCRMDKIPVEFWEADDGVWRSVVAHIVLSRTEREAWHNLASSESNRTEWLLTRLVAKDAVRLLMNEYYGLNLWPADIEIQFDKFGPPTVEGNWLSQPNMAPRLSISYLQGIAVAVAVDGNRYSTVGIECKNLGSMEGEVQKQTINLNECSFMTEHKTLNDGDWPLRISCAKDAIIRATGRKGNEFELDMIVSEVDGDTGMLTLEISEKSSEANSKFENRCFQVYTFREGDLIIANALCLKGDQYEK
ncbi:MAG: beta-ketoacyl synthase N-terminal-like domain-containing protein [Planctomycetota bacterium]